MIGVGTSIWADVAGVGQRGTAVPSIVLSNLSQDEGTAIGTTIGTISVLHGSGSYTFTITADPDSAFSITGASLKNAIAFDYETATSHSVTIQADNGVDPVITRTFSIAVGNVADAAPTVTTAATANCAENAQLAIALTATTDASESVTWSIVGGTDAADFEISGSTLRWASNGTQNYEDPQDSNTNNTYVVDVRATGAVSGLTDDQTITVTVTDVGGEATPVNLTLPAILGVPEVGEELTATTGTWTGAESFSFQWKSDGVNVGTDSDSYTLQASDLADTMTVVVRATNAAGTTAATSDGVGPVEAGASDPTTIFGADLVAWYKADTGVTESSGAVSEWADQSGNARHLTDVSFFGSSQYNATGFNGGPAIVLDNYDQLSTAHFAFNSNQSAFFVVLNITSKSGILLSYYDWPSANDHSDSASVRALDQSGSAEVRAQQGGGVRGTAAVSNGTDVRLGVVFDNVNSTFYVNNVSDAGAAASFTLGQDRSLVIGGAQALDAAMECSIAEVVVVKVAPDSTKRDALDAYFVARLGL